MPAGARAPVRLTVKQEQYCRQAIDINRFCYNLAVATHRFHRVNRLPWPSWSSWPSWPSWQDIYKVFNACKHEDYPFVTEVASGVAEGAFMDFGRAIANWRNPEAKARAPEFKRKKLTGTGSFRAASGVTQVRCNGKRRIQLPGLGSVKLDSTLPKGIYHEVHLKRENGHWRLCLKLWRAPEPIPENDNCRTGAVDTGINPIGTDSDGQEYENPRATYQMEKKLRRWQRAQARRQKGSRGWWEAQRKIDRRHRRIRGLRSNAQHQMTNTVTRKFRELVIEDLTVAGMMRGITPRAQADAGMGEVKWQLIYKSLWRHTAVTLAPVWYPSSKTCRACRAVNAKLKRERTWTCGNRGTSHDRNVNATLNLRDLILPPGRGRRSVTGRLWPFRKGRVEPARMIGEQHRPTLGKDKADYVFTECTHALRNRHTVLRATSDSLAISRMYQHAHFISRIYFTSPTFSNSSEAPAHRVCRYAAILRWVSSTSAISINFTPAVT